MNKTKQTKEVQEQQDRRPIPLDKPRATSKKDRIDISLSIAQEQQDEKQNQINENNTARDTD